MEEEKIEKIEMLDYYAIKALQDLPGWQYPDLKIQKTSRNVFLGSGNADNTGRILAQIFGGVALNIVNYQGFFENNPERDAQIYIVCASGGKDGVKMAQWLTNNGWPAKLLTNNPKPLAGKFLKPEDIFVFPANIEPPTYNVSTYASMLYGILKEDLAGLEDKIKNLVVPNLRQYKYIFFLVQDKYEPIACLAKRKIAETLAGVGADAGGFSNAAHGMLLQPNPDRLIFCLNTKFDGAGDKYELNFDSYLGLLLAVDYIIGKNQTDNDSQNILANYQQNALKMGWQFNKIW